MSKKLSLILYLALAGVCLAFFILTVLASTKNNGILQGGYSAAALTVFAVFLAVSVIAYNPNATFYSIGFYLTHAGILFFLVGCLIYAIFGYSVTVSPPSVASLTQGVQGEMYNDGAEIPSGYYNRIPAKDGGIIDLGFNFRVTDFVTEYYDGTENVKHYEATLGILDGQNEIERSLTVNHPIYVNGWKIYLMSVSRNGLYGYDEVSLTFKRDPGEILSTSGIILTVLGVFSMSFLRKKEGER
ncbi:MAG: cytochrome c biogenesis protein ResB [Clostridia bacterium]|nr:cytochrome c biogenesis protein ResB [Clostridia bacterium]